MRNWFKSEEEKAREKEEEMKERLGEVEVEREMIRETEEDKKEAEEMKAVERCGSVTPRPGSERVPGEGSVKSGTGARLKRTILPNANRGSVVSLRVFKEISILAVLIDIG